ncbi:hypothetical protein [Photorhabdus heterorhabditis]|uniref:hypothetical protein n=1 Tax=Photorhabdus heterorhabditis TaxID=880156 RepID=UPI001562A574|nr:hypothetical protein [Photorhabdus heterorhabditis]NRN29797.1 hypothetical protein [Photorhabdus heterorhabditis subsp. aluminescens]
MNLQETLNNEDYSDNKDYNKELINGSFNEGYKGWRIPAPESVKILSENDVHFIRIQSVTGSGVIDQIIEGLEPNTKYKLTGTARVSAEWASSAYFGLQSRTDGPNSFAVNSTDFTTGSIELSTDQEGLLRVYLLKDQVGPRPDGETADFTGFVLEKA